MELTAIKTKTIIISFCIMILIIIVFFVYSNWLNTNTNTIIDNNSLYGNRNVIESFDVNSEIVDNIKKLEILYPQISKYIPIKPAVSEFIKYTEDTERAQNDRLSVETQTAAEKSACKLLQVVDYFQNNQLMFVVVHKN